MDGFDLLEENDDGSLFGDYSGNFGGTFLFFLHIRPGTVFKNLFLTLSRRVTLLVG